MTDFEALVYALNNCPEITAQLVIFIVAMVMIPTHLIIKFFKL